MRGHQEETFADTFGRINLKGLEAYEINLVKYVFDLIKIWSSFISLTSVLNRRLQEVQ